MKKIKQVLPILICFFVLGSFSVNAQINDQIKTFKNYGVVNTSGLPNTSVVEVMLNYADLTSDFIGVYDGSQFVPYLLLNSSLVNFGSAMIDTEGFAYELIDNNALTSKDLLLEGDLTTKQINFNFDQSVTTKQINFVFAENVVLPKYVTVKALSDYSHVTILNNYPVTSSTISFPETTSSNWIVELTYTQPLRIAEIIFNNQNKIPDNLYLRFLANPNKNYTIYSNPDVVKSAINYKYETPNLMDDSDVIRLGYVSFSQNQNFKDSDLDGDGIIDKNDNCPEITNNDQTDTNRDGNGDVCEDFDKDGVINSVDNCVDVPNYNQMDIDQDGIGDTCDPDESRFTEKYPWIILGALIFASLIFVGLLIYVSIKIRKNNQNTNTESMQ